MQTVGGFLWVHFFQRLSNGRDHRPRITARANDDIQDQIRPVCVREIDFSERLAAWSAKPHVADDADNLVWIGARRAVIDDKLAADGALSGPEPPGQRFADHDDPR